jgi:hypothetical protein
MLKAIKSIIIMTFILSVLIGCSSNLTQPVFQEQPIIADIAPFPIDTISMEILNLYIIVTDNRLMCLTHNTGFLSNDRDTIIGPTNVVYQFSHKSNKTVQIQLKDLTYKDTLWDTTYFQTLVGDTTYWRCNGNCYAITKEEALLNGYDTMTNLIWVQVEKGLDYDIIERNFTLTSISYDYTLKSDTTLYFGPVSTGIINNRTFRHNNIQIDN